MRIFSFDPAVKYLGFCCVDFDIEWRDKFIAGLSALNEIYDRADRLTREQFLDEVTRQIRHLIGILNNIIQIRCINTWDLVPGTPAKQISSNIIPAKLKYLLNYLDAQYGPADIILLEYQMGINTSTPEINAQIQHHYVAEDASIEPLIPIVTPHITQITPRTMQNTPRIETIHPTMKNAYSVDKIAGGYDRFIIETGKTTANKKHSDYNFKYFVRSMTDGQLLEQLAQIKDKSFDMADAFTQLWAWLVINKFL